MIDEAAERGASLTRHLLAFARKQPLQPREVDVNALVLETAKLLRPTLGEHIEIAPLLADDAWTASVDPSQLTTAILNLALNARDAMPAGGKLTLETGNVHLDEAYADMHNEVTVGRLCHDRRQRHRLRDSGRAIWKRCSSRSSPPRKSARAPASVSAWCSASSSSPAATSRSTARKVTARRVKIYLPRATGADGAPTRPASSTVEGGNEIVLVVEDDALVRKYVDRPGREPRLHHAGGRQRHGGPESDRQPPPRSICCSPT